MVPDGLMPIAAQPDYGCERHVRTERADDKLFATADDRLKKRWREAGAVGSLNPVRDIF